MWNSWNVIGLLVCAGVSASPVLATNAPTNTSTLQFEERALAAGLGFKHVQLGSRMWAVYGTGGVAADFNNDGWTDVYVIGGGDSFDGLFINQGLDANGRVHFVNEASAWGVRTRHHGFGSSAADYDNDGDLDLFVTSFGEPTPGAERNGQHKLYRNDLLADGSRVFIDVAREAGVNQNLPTVAEGLGSAWGDPDKDGDLDLFVTGYLPNHVSNRMYRNDGDGTFSDVTTLWGLDFDGCSGFVPGFVDMQGNRRPDLLLVADTGTSRVFTNRGLDENGVPQFEEQTVLYEDLQTANGMGSAIGDLDRDGDLDWYVTSIYFQESEGPGNVLMMQGEDRTFSNVAKAVGVDNGGWAWSAVMVDFDHDRDLDIAEVNGWPSVFFGRPPIVYEQTAPMTFVNRAQESGFNKISEGRGMVNADFDNDGDQDMIVFNIGQFMNYYENTRLMPEQPVPSDANWLRIELDTSARPTLASHGLHASITVGSNGEEHLLSIDGGFSHCSQGEIGAHLGLGDATSVDWIRIKWIDGSNTTIENIDANQILTVRAAPYWADLNNDGLLDLSDVSVMIDRYLEGSLEADTNGNGMVTTHDLYRFTQEFVNGR